MSNLVSAVLKMPSTRTIIRVESRNIQGFYDYCHVEDFKAVGNNLYSGKEVSPNNLTVLDKLRLDFATYRSDIGTYKRIERQ